MNKPKTNIAVLLKDSWVLPCLLLVACVGIAFLVAKINIIISPLIILFTIGSAVVSLVFYDFRWGFYGGLILTSIMFYFERVVPFSVPYGVFCDLLFLVAFVAMVLDKKQRTWIEYSTHPITVGYFLLFVYQIFQVFNPNSVSLLGWLASLRSLIFPLILLTAFGIVASTKGIKMLISVWLAIATLAASYAIYQEIFGLTGFEMRWVSSDPIRYGLYFIIGHMRKFSFLSDPSAFGVFMAYSALASFSLMFAPLSTSKRLLLGISFILMFMSMLYSGTRTAYAMVFIGIVFFILISIRKKATFVATFLLVFAFVLIMFGPFYNRYVNRLRSAFRPSEDASMEVRDVKRIRWQPYIWDHPIGGGLNTTGSPGLKFSAGHELAGGWDPDSGYLKIALEQGWIGLALVMIFFLMVMIKGIDNYFNLRDPMMQSINLSFLIPFFAVSIANFTQNAILYKPLFLFVIITYAVLIHIQSLEKNKIKI
ncbi:MAG: O-antigen ligase family protein [Cyclobacteriaceae bacterium]|nr:O-antigen ligase family protein [Cyclobacteriaceae bacterium]